jgi:hypothetical protein
VLCDKYNARLLVPAPDNITDGAAQRFGEWRLVLIDDGDALCSLDDGGGGAVRGVFGDAEGRRRVVTPVKSAPGTGSRRGAPPVVSSSLS